MFVIAVLVVVCGFYVYRASLACEMKVKDQTSVVLPILCQLYAREFEPSAQG